MSPPPPSRRSSRRPELPPLSSSALGDSLARLAPEPLPPQVVDALRTHYAELRRWLPQLGLIGKGTVEDVLTRHYGESLAALDLVPALGELLDVGSGAGFPGIVLAAARPRLSVTLIEPRQRKWAFLRQVSRAASLSCTVLDARVGSELPSAVPAALDRITVRALRLNEDLLAAFTERLAPEGRILAWVGKEEPRLPGGLKVVNERPIGGSEHRRILVIGRTREDGVVS